MLEYNHLIDIDEKQKKLFIYRVYQNGKKHLFTQVDLPEVIESNSIEVFREFSQILGENILIDSDVVRRHFKM